MSYFIDTILLKTSFATFINIYLFFHICEKNGTNIHLEDPFNSSQRHESMVVVCLVQRLLDELKQSDHLNVI